MYECKRSNVLLLSTLKTVKGLSVQLILYHCMASLDGENSGFLLIARVGGKKANCGKCIVTENCP